MASALEDVQAEDYVEYFLFPDGIPGDISKKEVNDYLKNVFSVISCCAAEHKREYIWHKDPFNIAPISDTHVDESLPPHLHGTTHFGDNIEDEWFIVYLLVQLTKDIPGLVVRVIDTDGEFLLIEAADFLPSWADPETCGQRVYIYQGEVHFIPPSNTNDSGDEPRALIPVSDAIRIIRLSPHNTRAPQPIQNAIKGRIEGYPSKIKEDLHRTTVCIPAEISALLKENPSLIAPSVRAFCERDPIDKRACRNMVHFKPENCVPSSCLYAMLCHEKAVPEKRSGWSLPPPSSPTFKMYNLGFKVACGFEILVDRAKKSGEPLVKSITAVQVSDLSGNRGWAMYLDSLKKKGYFKELLEGSKEYTALLEKAKEFYVNNCMTSSQVIPDSSAGHEIMARLSTLKLDIEALKEESKNIPAPDDDSWLEISPEEVDLMLKNRLKKDQLSGQGGLASVLGGFLDYMSGMEGAEFPTKDEGLTGAKPKTQEIDNSAVDGKLNFDPEGFSCAVQNILDFAIPEDSWDLNSDSDDSDIGSYEDDGEMDLNELKPVGKKKSPDPELKQYMDQMDRELANTTLAQSFEKKTSKTEKKVQSVPTQEDDTFDDVEDFRPVDIDMNALKNILESYQSQMGGAGPASNLLGPMGVHLENLAKKRSSDENDN
ncbi:LOW QUALITY PROTEIN: Protein ecdysoneless [Frankliniella fusca]|uniref:Protein ecdysoneless n=1 Tax=Frankliniella fusca TaxID=407009 RepID=A0AAE1HP03_9NEOP|nr:LOW QUALITY PROTEIN: Protein ecdysoneless [Frankliniella fusca]